MNTTAFQIGMYAYTLLFDRWASYNELTRRYEGAWQLMTDTLWVCKDVQGQYVKMESISGYPDGSRTKWFNRKFFAPLTPAQMPVAMAKLQSLMELRMLRTTREWEIQARNAQANADAIADKKAYDLSVNTVTRALVHASDNGYCSETVLALTSAGHRMPTTRVVVRATVLIPIELDGKEDYIATRQIFGMTRGNIGSLVGERVTEDAIMNRVRDSLADTNVSLEYSYYNSDSYPVVAEADVDFGKPVIRPLADVTSERPAYASDDNDY